jgi:ribosome-binding factor A
MAWSKPKHFKDNDFCLLKRNLSQQNFVFRLHFTKLRLTEIVMIMATEKKRQLQVAELIKRHFSVVMQNEGSYIYGAEPLVTVTQVKVSPDFSLAKIYLSVYNTEHKQGVILEMEEHTAHLRQALGARIRKQVRRIPDVAFYLDDTLDEMYRLRGLFGQLHEEEQMGEEEE